MNRRYRLIAALGIAVMLVTFMAYVVIKGTDIQEPVLQANELKTKYELASSRSVQVDGIAAGPVTGEKGEKLTFFVTDRAGKNPTRVEYEGSVPDAFRVGRNVIMTGQIVEVDGERVFQAKANSLVTKCPSKFESDGGTSRSDG